MENQTPLNFEKIIEEARRNEEKYFKENPDQKRVWVDPHSDDDYEDDDPYPDCNTFHWHSCLLERYQRLTKQSSVESHIKTNTSSNTSQP